MNSFTIDFASTQSLHRPGDRGFGDEKHLVGASRAGFARSVWPFLVNARRDPEGELISEEKDQSGFAS